MANLGASPMPGVRAMRLVRNIALRMAARGGELLATMIDVEPSRLRAEVAAIRPSRRWLMVALVASIGGSIFGTVAAILYLTSSETAAAPAEQAVVQLAAASSESYDAIVTRPLFYRSRQPATAPAERPNLPALGDPQVTLRGIFINGDLAKAFIVSGESPAGVWRKRGEDVAGWRIAEIFSNRVVLESRAQQLVVPLSYANGR
jgi:hypothetical protein